MGQLMVDILCSRYADLALPTPTCSMPPSRYILVAPADALSWHPLALPVALLTLLILLQPSPQGKS